MVLGCRSFARAWLALSLAGMVWACGSSEPKETEDAATDAAVDEDAAVDSGARDSSRADATTGDSTVADARTDAQASVPPTLESVRVRQAGRFGHDLRIDVVGSDSDGDAVAVRLELFDGAGAPVSVNSQNGNVPLSTALANTPQATGYAVLPLYYRYRDHGTVRRAKVSLVDGTGQVSNVAEVDVTIQTTVALSEQCDATYVENRCEAGLGCKGSLPSTCLPGDPPTISRAGYYSDELGPRVLIEGMDPDDDVTSYTIEFLDAASGSPVPFDEDNDPATPSITSLMTQVDVAASAGTFYFRFEPTAVFVETVTEVRLTVTDLGGRASTAYDSTLGAAPQRAANASCDARGFDRCAANTVCTRASPNATTTTCVALNTARTRACSSALVLNPFAGINSVSGQIASPSLWDAPDSCSTANPKFRPEALVKLLLTRPISAAGRVVLSSDHPSTAFDSTLYAIAGCSGTDAVPTLAWCADDQPPPAANANLAVLEILGPLPMGDYFVIVDSFTDGSGTTFQLGVTVSE